MDRNRFKTEEPVLPGTDRLATGAQNADIVLRRRMNGFVTFSPKAKAFGWTCAALVVGLTLYAMLGARLG